MSRHRFPFCFALVVLSIMICLGGSVLIARQEQPKATPRPSGEPVVKKEAPPAPHQPNRRRRKSESEASPRQVVRGL